MSRGPETTPDPPGPPARWRSPAWLLALAVLGGCENASPRGSGPDPLVTSSTLAPSPAAGGVPGAAAPAPAATATATPGKVPDLPASISLPSTGALAGGGAPAPAPDSGRNDIRIPALPTGNPAPAAGGTTPGWPLNCSPPTPPPTGSALQPPEAAGAARLAPVPAGTVPTVPFTSSAPAWPAAGTPADPYCQLQEMLRVRGVTWQRLETTGDTGEWKFRCSVPNKQNRNMGRYYEARAVGDYGLAAIRAAIDQIDRETGTPPPAR